MISLYAETYLSTFAVIFYTCACVPFLQIWRTVVRFCRFLVDPHHQPHPESSENPNWELDLPVCKYQELQGRNKDSGGDEEMCSICLVEFEEEDSVNKLPKCGHLYHAECLEKWLGRCQFTCPLCRSSLLRVRSSPCSMSTAPPFCIDLPHDHDQ